MTVTDVLVSTLIGIPIGLLTSFVSWWILFHMLTPKVRFSTQISKARAATSDRYAYRVKLRNVGRRRIVDAEFFARLRIQALDKGSNNWAIFHIPLDEPRIPMLPPHRRRGHIEVLYVSQVNNTHRFPSDIAKKIEDGTVLLEDLMRLGKQSTLQLIGFGYDSFSGTRTIFESALYTINDIMPGRFAKNSFDITSGKPSAASNEQDEEET